MNPALAAYLGALSAVGDGPPTALVRSVWLGSITLAIVGIIFVWLVTRLGVIGMAVYFQATCPKASERMVTLYESRGMRCFFIGLLNAVLGFLLGLLLISTEVLGLLGLAVWTAVIALAAIGFGVVYASLARRMAAASGTAPSLKGVAKAGLVLEGAFLVPVVGKILLLGVAFRGLGAVVSTLLAWRRLERSGAAPSEAASPKGIHPEDNRT